jgi:hypothetical protein
MAEQGEEWTENEGGVEGRVTEKGLIRQVAKWIVGTFNAIIQTAQNALRKKSYEWLLD